MKLFHFNVFYKFRGHLLSWLLATSVTELQSKSNVYRAKGTNKINTYGSSLYKYLSSETQTHCMKPAGNVGAALWDMFLKVLMAFLFRTGF